MGKYIHLYSTEQEFEADYNGAAYIEPWVSLTLDVDRVDYNKTPVPPTPVDPSTYPFTIEALGNGNIVWNIGSKSLQYSMDDGETWETFTSPLAVSAGDKVQFKGTNSSSFFGNCLSGSTMNFNVEGNIMSLFAGDNFANVNTIMSAAFTYLFDGCTQLKSAENLALPVTDLTNAYGCYSQMFKGCTSITKAPILPAQTLVPDCYAQMFSGCTNLTYIKCLATSIPMVQCTADWVNGVAASGTFVKDASMTGWATGTGGIPSGWTIQDA